MNLRTTVIVPDFGRYTCDVGVEVATTRWMKQWNRPRRPVGLGDFILGQHLYYRRPKTRDNQVEDDLIHCKVRWSNGAVMPDGTGFRGKVYFEQLAIGLSDEKGWTIVALPARGSAVQDSASGLSTWFITTRGTHVFLPRWILEREFVVARRGSEAKALQLLRREGPFAPVIPPKVTNYGPLGADQPTVDRDRYQATRTSEAQLIEQAIAAGTPAYVQDVLDVEVGSMGPWLPHGANTEYSQGGLDIDPCTGFEQCPAGLRVNALIHQLTMARAPMALYHADTGEVLRLDEWANASLGHGVLMQGEVGFTGTTELPAFVVGDYYTYRYPVLNPDNSCPYEAALRQYRCPDAAHARRLSVNAEPLAAYEGCPMATDDLTLAFEWGRHAGFSNRDDEHGTPQWDPPTLTETHNIALLSPGQGWPYDRAFGWTLYHAACAKTFVSSPACARSADEWCQMAQETYCVAADPVTSILQRESNPSYMPANVQGTQIFHSAILAIGLAASKVSPSLPSDWDTSGEHVAQTLRNYCLAVYGSMTLVPIDDPYAGVSLGVPHWVWTWQQVIGRDGAPTWAPIRPLDNAHAATYGDPVHILAALYGAWKLTGDRTLLELGRRFGTPQPDLRALLAWLKAGPLESRAQNAYFEAALEAVLAAP